MENKFTFIEEGHCTDFFWYHQERIAAILRYSVIISSVSIQLNRRKVGNFTPRNEASGIPMDTAVVKGAAGLSPTNVFSLTT